MGASVEFRNFVMEKGAFRGDFQVCLSITIPDILANPPRKALGRGLDSLISMDDVPAVGASAINDIPLDRIQANPDQPRRDFDEEALADLAASIRELGIIQPVSLRKTGPDSYQIIAGERRCRAARIAGLDRVPAYIRSVSESELTEMALIENVQRQDLNPIEIALTLRKLIEQYSLTQERLSERIGMKRTTIANFMRLVNLPAEVQLGLRDRVIDVGHARALLSVTDPHDLLALYKRTVKEGLSVRRVEELARQLAGKKPEVSRPGQQPSQDYDLLRDHLSARFKTPVQFSCDAKGRGKITIPFKSEEELEKILANIDQL